MKDKYYVLLNGSDLVQVTEQVWQTYYRGRAKERYMRKTYNEHCVSLDSFLYEGALLSALTHITKTPEDLVQEQVERETLYAAILTLDNKERVIIYAYFFLGYTEAEIGSYLGISQQAINMRKKSALKKLKHLLYEDYDLYSH